ncbi:VOC family protein [Maritimibacter sp. 55A14]|uniref:VOC family protein n=1 Tax=Maritimibacter sp. 55A14 TaxID=2174844 RepID=UPI000D620A42|nr:VOC family protein [Maritimibacter sp. 55A14]PWE30527.1 VOC family protein [Maritimibacter sp. 55A14]
MQNRHFTVRLDHLAVTAPDLAAGLAHCHSGLGLLLPQGGAHPAMATHNHLMALGDAEYLEVIAPDPAAPPPGRARWFALDQRRPARLATWVVRVGDLDAAIAAAPLDLGRAIEMSRDDLRWRIAVRDDGSLPMDGAFPTLIEWPDIDHPAGMMVDLHARLRQLQIETPQAPVLSNWLMQNMDDRRIQVRQAPLFRLTAQITVPGGQRELR